MASSPTARTLKLLRDAGYTADVTERWNPHAKVRHDLFGFADVVAARSDQVGVLFVQSTSADNVSHRMAKIRQEPRVRTVLLAGNRVCVHGWRKVKGKWEAAIRWVWLRDLEPVERDS